MLETNEYLTQYEGSNWRDLAQEYLIDSVGTFSKRADQFVEHVYPTHCYSQTGAFIDTTFGTQVLDWVGALGANMMGTDESHSLPTVWEVMLAHQLSTRIGPYKFKLLREGSAACCAAVRYARAYTGRTEVIGVGYHGYHDLFISEEQPGLGCVNESYRKFTSLQHLHDHLYFGLDTANKTAAVIIEPCVLHLSDEVMVRQIRYMCRKMGVLFIADEIVSGGRVPQFTFSKFWRLDPDIIVLGKPLALGHPVGIVGVARDLIKQGVFVSTTFAGSVSTIKSCLMYLNEITDERLQWLWEQGSSFMSKFNNLSKRVQLIGYPTRMTWEGDETDIAIFWQEMLRLGHLLGKAFFFTFGNVNHADKLLSDAETVLRRMESETVVLEGLAPRPVFRRF